MAWQGVEVDQEQLMCCSICLDLLEDPVTVPCGHRYCRSCIEGFWEQDDQRARFSCPQCRDNFRDFHTLKNTMLTDLVESLKRTGLQDVPPGHCYAEPGEVACDVCTGISLKAVKTCLQCLVSYCDAHLQPHYKSRAFKKHKLVKPVSELQEKFCTRHNKVRELFCRTDRQLICSLCSVEEHKGHNMISAAAERTERQKELYASQQNIQQRIQEREKDLRLYQEVESINRCADRAVEDCDAIFKEMISSMERRRSEVRQQIREQQRRQVSRAEELRRRVEQQVSELRRRHAELEQLSLTEDHIHFLQRHRDLSRISESTHPVSSDVRPLIHFDDVTAAVSKMRDKIEHVLTEERTKTNVSETLNRVDVSLVSTPPEPKTRAEFLQYSRPLTLDPNTAHQLLSLSKGNRKVTRMSNQSYPDHPERFINVQQVLSKEALTGRSYWEVEWSGGFVGGVFIAVSYKDISRAGEQCVFGYNDKSWSLECTDGYTFRHRRIKTDIPMRVSSRVGVYVDHGAGTLSFYRVSDTKTLTLLHTVQTTFTHNLHAGLWPLLPLNTAELCDLK